MIDVLLLCDDIWHPAEVIELGIKSLASLYNFTVVKTAKDILTPERIAKYPVIICSKGNVVNAANNAPWFEENVTEVCPKEFEEYVKNGGGFLSLHSGNTSREGDPYANFVGNYFVGHPPRCTVDVKMTALHPIANDMKDFQIRDEHYNINLTATDADVFCKTFSNTGGEQIGGYTRNIGKGRLCVLTPGHTLDVWHHTEFEKLLCNAINWCAGIDK